MTAAGYSGTPLARKLGITAGVRVFTVGAPAAYREWLAPLPPGVTFARRVDATTNVAHVFASGRAELRAALADFRRQMAPDAAVWVSWPKKSSGIASEVTEDTVRELALPLGFVDIKVCAVSEVWSGLKLVVRKALR
jgi:hypothetical protein